ncbi:MAG: PDZ domain-containing protein [Planctomycetota bacterium]
MAADTPPSPIEARDAAEARLRAAMPFSFMTADPKKLEPALTAAKLAGVEQSVILEAEAKLREAKTKTPRKDAVEAEARLRAAMPFSFMVADPSKLEPALAAAKLAGVTQSVILEAEAKLQEAKAKADATDDVVLLMDMPDIATSTLAPDVIANASYLATDAKVIGKPFLGVGIRDPTNSIVTTLYGDSTAAQLGIVLGDAIVSVNGTPITDIDSLRSIVGATSIGSDVTIVILRDGNEFTIGPLPLGERHE